ncbi:hypothetical protein MTR_5g089380 [Medicago truncatula]|uniref:Uncharacterized protein n=1 Tax=Medicago truncatula TaxID=3880 RepID=G7K326_MEDTR|nr:hypothetical protein MTR_5g089380 [Medicago truncatula]
MMVQWARLTRPYGLRIQQPVIPPLSREGSVHCSVKPASCGSLHSRDQEICAFAKIPWPNSQLGAGRPA